MKLKIIFLFHKKCVFVKCFIEMSCLLSQKFFYCLGLELEFNDQLEEVSIHEEERH